MNRTPNSLATWPPTRPLEIYRGGEPPAGESPRGNQIPTRRTRKPSWTSCRIRSPTPCLACLARARPWPSLLASLDVYAAPRAALAGLGSGDGNERANEGAGEAGRLAAHLYDQAGRPQGVRAGRRFDRVPRRGDHRDPHDARARRQGLRRRAGRRARQLPRPGAGARRPRPQGRRARRERPRGDGGEHRRLEGVGRVGPSASATTAPTGPTRARSRRSSRASSPTPTPRGSRRSCSPSLGRWARRAPRARAGWRSGWAPPPR